MIKNKKIWESKTISSAKGDEPIIAELFEIWYLRGVRNSTGAKTRHGGEKGRLSARQKSTRISSECLKRTVLQPDVIRSRVKMTSTVLFPAGSEVELDCREVKLMSSGRLVYSFAAHPVVSITMTMWFQ